MRAAICCAVTTLFSFQPSQAQTLAPPGGKPSPPAFSSALARVALPEGTFHGWCGIDDAFLMRNGREFRLHRWGGGPGTTIPIMSQAGAFDLRCDERVENAVYSHDKKDHIDIYHFNFKTQASSLIASASKSKSYPLPTIASSPNALHIAYNPDTIDVTKMTTTAHLQLLKTSGSGIRWKSDSSILFGTIGSPVTPESNRSNYSQRIEIVHAKTAKRVSGNLPRGYRVQNGTFVSGGGDGLLLLFLTFYDDDLGNEDGAVFSCFISTFSCQSSISKVRQVSISEKADVATTKWIFDTPPPRPNDDSTILPNRYLVQVIRRDSKVLQVAEFSSEAAIEVNVTISPSGALAAVTWLAPNSRCGPTYCQMGALLDLRGSSP
jgi:hypothetical protein